MNNIGGFFEKFKNKVTKQVQSLVLIIEIIKKHTGISLEMKDISISSGKLILKASSLQKNVIFIKKSQIIREIRERTSLTIEDIR